MAVALFLVVPMLLAVVSPPATVDARAAVDAGASSGPSESSGAADAPREADRLTPVDAAIAPLPERREVLPVEWREPSPTVLRTPLLGEIAGLELHVPVLRAEVIGYHQASTNIAKELVPIGHATANGTSSSSVTSADDGRGVRLLIMASRGRGSPRTSAVDVAARPGVAVVAPVTGTVTDVRSYRLYGSYLDYRIEIRPEDAPDLRVVLVHVEGLLVSTGDEVLAGRTPLGEQVRQFPFASQIDRETEPNRFGHVHLEVQPFGARRPGDPWE